MKKRIPKMVTKLTPAETKRLEHFIREKGGQVKASVLLGCAPATLSRTINGHTATSALLREKLVGVGVVKA